jgi:HK97 family phage prohead protease
MTARSRRLYASAPAAPAPLTFAAPAAATCEDSKRQISGLVLPYGTPGRTSAGILTASKGTVKLPGDLSRVKLLHGHRTDPNHTVVGHLLTAEDTDQGLRLTFQLGSGAAADAALTAAKEKLTDGLSVEFSEYKAQGQALTTANLDAVALVAIPAFADARVSVIAQQTASEPAAPTVPSGPARYPATMQPPAPAAQASAVSVLDAARALLALHTHQATPELTAALQDITVSGNPNVAGPAWLGKLWDGSLYRRQIVPLLSNKPLTARTANGWKWVNKPQVGDWAGNKTEIPSNAVSTEPISMPAQRIAGGHDIDRAFFDFNDAEFIASYWEEATSDYAYKTDVKAADFINTNASPLLAADGVTPVVQTDLLKAAALAVTTVRRQTREPQASPFVLVNDEDLLALLDVTNQNAPAYLAQFGITPDRFIATPLIPAGKIIAGVKAGVWFYELPGSPIRVRTTDLPRGGEDAALFGYWAALLHDDKALLSIDIAA